MRSLRLGLMFLSLLILVPPNHAQPDNVDSIHSAVVKIEVMNEEKVKTIGSGVIVAEDGIIFTNLHVIELRETDDSDTDFRLRVTVGDDQYEARELYRGNQDPGPSYFDFAIIEIFKEWGVETSDTPNIDFPYIQNWATRLDIGDIIYTAGYPEATNHEFATQQASISSITDPFPTFDRSISEGESGGVVYNSDGELVGLLFQFSVEEDTIINRTEFLHIDYICRQVPDQCEKYRPSNLINNSTCQQPQNRSFCDNSRLNINITAQIGSLESQVQLRQDPFWDAVWLKPLPRGAFVTIIGGPQTTFNEVLQGFGFFWWQVRDSDGIVGWIPEDYFGEPLLIPSDVDNPIVPAAICELNTRTAANIRNGPGSQFDQIASRRNNQPLAADGQINGSDGMIWWQLIDGFWVREDSVTEDPTCFTLPTVNR